MLKIFRFMARDLRGASLTDFSLIAAIVAVVGFSALRAVGAKAATVLHAAGPSLI
jgi:Flp pilus assembly pilin Flp